MQSFPGFFLTFLGEGLLQQLYRGFITHDKSSLIGAFDSNERLVGFVAYSENISEFYCYLIKESLFPIIWYCFKALFKKGSIVCRLFRAFYYPRNSKRNEPYVVLASIGILPGFDNQGVGSQLVDALKQDIYPNHFAYIKIETDKVNNDRANAFYEKNGFKLHNCFVTPEGRFMNEYRYLYH